MTRYTTRDEAIQRVRHAVSLSGGWSGTGWQG